MRSKTVFVAFLLAAPTLALAAPSGQDDTTRTFTQTVSAAGLTSVALDATVGDIRVTTADTDTVSIKAAAEPGSRMHFIFDWTTGPAANKLPADLHLIAARKGSRLVIGLATAAGTASLPASAASAASAGHHIIIIGGNSYGSGEHSWKADWTLVLPTRLALELNTGVGKATVSGVGGGVQAKIGVGKLDLRLPRGPMDATVGVGNVEAAIGSADYGKVSLAAGVGHVSFEVNGHTIRTGYQHHFTSAEQKLNGPGKTAYKLKAGVGHVNLRLGVKNLTKSSNDNAQGGH